MPFYSFNQNNSGGVFVLTDKLTHHVIIEAGSVEEANDKLESLGGYFNGCETGMDCECCGDRWYRLWKEVMGDPVPMIYGRSAEDHINGGNILWMNTGKNVVVHYADGKVEWF